ncbi:uncharacterized protein BJX67DRAFT_318987 [Aspergillus lucknowensis]|uniref:Uncharacterized protein n=1 Tax=Aspergillus lucknowensis TaxID=176173 RepID=A0ABR4LZ35_9EURO
MDSSRHTYLAMFMWYSHIGLTFGVTFYAYFAAFSRFTSSRSSPRLYTYQLSSTGDKASYRFAPFLEMTLATLIVFQKTRTVALFFYGVFHGLGIILRLRKINDVGTDIAFQSIIGVAYWSCSVLESTY